MIAMDGGNACERQDAGVVHAEMWIENIGKGTEGIKNNPPVPFTHFDVMCKENKFAIFQVINYDNSI